MKRLVLIIVFMFLISLSSCDISLSEEDSDIYTPEEVVTPITGLRPYVPVELEEVVDETREVDFPEEFIGERDEKLLGLVYPSISQFLRNGFLKALFEGLGLDWDNLLDSSLINPRSITGKAELHVTDEGVKIKNGYYNIADASIDYLDVTAEGESVNFMKFLFNALDGSEWPYSQKSANMSGSVGLSLSCGVRSTDNKLPDDLTLEKASASMYLTADIKSIKLGQISTKDSDGNISSFYFPSYGTLKFKAEMSLAQSVVTYLVTEDSVEGYPILGEVKQEYISKYVPNRVWLSVKESSEFKVRDVFNLIKSLVSSSSSVSSEAIWKKVCDIIWKNQSGPYIKLGVDFLDDGTGEKRGIVLVDNAILQFLF